MTPVQYQRLKELFGIAVHMDGTRRGDFVRQACQDDPQLQTELEALLQYHASATLIDRPVAPRQMQALGQVASPLAPSPQKPAGTRIADRYRIVHLLGRGAMGEVYLADDLVVGEPVALKFLSPQLATEPAWVARLREEVRLARQVTHPNICRIHDIVETPQDVFVSMEYVDGEDLASLLRRIGRLPADKVVDVAMQLCVGLAAAHAKGILHRDLKPTNIMIDGQGRVRILDFGVALLMQTEHRVLPAGTPAYMAPEVLVGSTPSVRSDIYALGLVLYQMATGRLAIEARSVQERLSHSDPPVPPRQYVAQLDPALERVILRCIDGDPGQRPASALAVAAALPGADPLMVTLAAGLTPSPDTVAGAKVPGVRFGRVAGLLAASVLGLACVVLLSDRTFFLSRAGLEQPPAALEAKARQVIGTLARTDQTRGRAFGFVTVPAASDRPDGRAVLFEYGQDQPLAATPRVLALPQMPRMSWPSPGTRYVCLDPRGRLVRYTAVASPQTLPDGATPDWSAPFAMAGLRWTDFTPSPPDGSTAVYADTLRAWQGHAPDDPARLVRVDAAALGPEIVQFQVTWGDGKGLGAASPATAGSSQLQPLVRYGLFFVVLIGGGVLAWQNTRQGRGDRRGAWRVAMFLLIAQGLLWGVLAPHSSAPLAEVGLILAGLRQALLVAVVGWILYMAIEPQVRRLWPQSMISWSRVLLGRWRDPLVGQDLLAGVIAGIVIVLILQVDVLAADWTGGAWAGAILPAGGAELGPLAGPGYKVSEIVHPAMWAVWTGLGLLLLMLLLRRTFGATWGATAFAIVAVVALALTADSVTGPPWLTSAVVAIVLAVVLLRIGLLAAVVSLFVQRLLTASPVTADVHAWYFQATALVLGVLVALLLLGAHASRTRCVGNLAGPLG